MLKSINETTNSTGLRLPKNLNADLCEDILALCAAVVNAKQARAVELWQSGITQEKLSQLTLAWDDATDQLARYLLQHGLIDAAATSENSGVARHKKHTAQICHLVAQG